MRVARRLLVGIAALLVTTACAEVPAADTAATSKVTLTWWDYFGYSPVSNQAVSTLISKYEDAHPNVEIVRTSVAFPQFHDKIVQAAASGTFPDIAVIDSPDVPLLASQDAIADLTPRFAKWRKSNQFLESVRDSVTYDDLFYGVPLRSNTTALLYNKDHFAQAGVTAPPRNWAELRSTAKQLTQGDQFGVCFAASANEQLTFNFLPFLWQAGGDVRTIGDKASVDALSFVDALLNVDKSAPRTILEWGHSDVEKAFVSGKCSMMINGPWVVQPVSKAGFDWAAAPLPSGASGSASPLGGEAWVIGAKSPNADAAWELLSWLAESRNSANEIGGGLGGIPNRNDTLNDPAWKWGPGVAVFINEMLTTRPRSVYGPKYPKVSEAIWIMTQQVLTGKQKPQQAANEAHAKIEPLLPSK